MGFHHIWVGGHLGHVPQLIYINFHSHSPKLSPKESGAPGLVDRVFSVYAGSRGFDSHRRHMSERFFRSNSPGFVLSVCSELENSGIRVAVNDCNVTERRLWRPPYQTGKSVQVHTKHFKHDENGRTAPGVRGHGSVLKL